MEMDEMTHSDVLEIALDVWCRALSVNTHQSKEDTGGGWIRARHASTLSLPPQPIRKLYRNNVHSGELHISVDPNLRRFVLEQSIQGRTEARDPVEILWLGRIVPLLACIWDDIPVSFRNSRHGFRSGVQSWSSSVSGESEDGEEGQEEEEEKEDGARPPGREGRSHVWGCLSSLWVWTEKF